MTERPIIFTTDSIKAMLAGRKTQTRRVIGPQPDDAWMQNAIRTYGNHWTGDERSRTVCVLNGDREIRCPYGRPGDSLWVREAWQECAECGLVNWRAGANDNGISCQHCDNFLGKWKSPIFMPRWASRITLRVVDVRVEQLQDISEADALAEGIDMESDFASLCINIEDAAYQNDMPGGSATKAVYRKLWDSINARRGYSWASNPWVWVVEFEVKQ